MTMELNSGESLEVLSFLPSYEGKIVLQLGECIGHFTGELAKKARTVIVLDSKESEIKKHKSITGHHENVEYMCGDVTSDDLSLPTESMHLIFSSWLSVHLSDKEVEDIAKKLLKWVKVGGYIFSREPCSLQSGDHKQNRNPEQFRSPRFYTTVFRECHMSDASGKSSKLSLVRSKCIRPNEENENDQYQICWIWKKVNSEDGKGFQQLLDNGLYTSSGILRYERIFGQGFLSIGGLETTKDLVSKLDLKAGQRVLDVGCGIGGSTFYMADNFDVNVVGIDLSVNMISFALERAIEHKCLVEFEVADCTKKSYSENTFDVIYSRETIIHIQDKPTLFQTFYKWLKPGGKVLVSDYFRKAGTPSADFVKYIKKRRYVIDDVETYGQIIKDAGFEEVIIEDRTEQFKDVLERDMTKLEKEKEELIGDFCEEDYRDFVRGWKAKQTRTCFGEQRWGVFFAKKK